MASDGCSGEGEQGLYQQLVAKPNSTSKVWWYFGFVPNGIGIPADTNKATCKLCARSVSCKGGNTSNLFTHLRIHHCAIHSQLKAGSVERSRETTTVTTVATTPTTPIQQTCVTEPITVDFIPSTPTVQTTPTSHSQNSKKWKTLTDAVTRFMVKNTMPLHLVESPGFSELLRAFDHQYELPSSKFLSQTAIPTLYEQTRAAVVGELQQAEYFSVSVENLEQYLCCTVHFVGVDWKLHSRCINTLYFPEEHRARNFSEALPTILESWGLPVDKLMCITSGASLVPAISGLCLGVHLSCFGDNLQLAVATSIKDDRSVNHALSVCRKLVCTFSHNWRKRLELTRAQVDHGLPNHSLVAGNPSHWGSQQKMIERILEQEAALCQVLSSHLLPSWRDIDVLQSVKKALSPLKEFTDVLSDKNYVMASAVRPVLQHMREEILSKVEGDTQLALDIKHKTMSYMDCKYTDPAISKLLSVATFLDPRFRTDYINTVDLEGVKERVGSEAVEEQLRGLSIDHLQATVQPSKKRKLGDVLKKSKERASISSAVTPVEIVQQEVERYLQAPQPDVDSDPLDWWKMNETIYPNLAKLAKKYLCICATSTTAERLFSTSSETITCKLKSCHNPDKVNMQVFLAKNL